MITNLNDICMSSATIFLKEKQIPSKKNNHDPRKRNKARQDFGSKSCDVMSDSDSEITFEMNAFYPQISGPSL